MATTKAQKSPSMPFFGKQFYDDETVWLSSLAHQGLYVALLWNQWKEGSIPADLKLIARLVGQSERDVRKLWAEVSKHFAPHATAEGRLVNAPLEAIRNQKAKFSKDQTDRANARWHPESDAEPDAKSHTGRRPERMLAVAVAVPSSEEPRENSTFSKSRSRSSNAHDDRNHDRWAPPWTERQFQYKADKIAEWTKAKASEDQLIPGTEDFDTEFEAAWGMSYDRWQELRPRCEAYFSARGTAA